MCCVWPSTCVQAGAGASALLFCRWALRGSSFKSHTSWSGYLRSLTLAHLQPLSCSIPPGSRVGARLPIPNPLLGGRASLVFEVSRERQSAPRLSLSLYAARLTPRASMGHGASAWRADGTETQIGERRQLLRKTGSGV